MPLNHSRPSRRFEKSYDFELPASKKKRPTTPAQPMTQLTAEQIERQIATDNSRAFKSDAEVVLVNLSLSAWTSRADLKRILKAKSVTFEDVYLQRLLSYLSDKNKVVSKSDTWKKT